jgi:hypothetical protein
MEGSGSELSNVTCAIVPARLMRQIRRLRGEPQIVVRPRMIEIG